MIAPVFERLAALADPIRARLLLAVEQQEMAVNELRIVLQLPQSTISRHLKVLADEGWITSRASGATNWYRIAAADLDPNARRLWQVVRDECADTPAAERDAERVKSVVTSRTARSQEFFATSAGKWDKLREDLFGPEVEWLALSGLIDPEWTIADLGTGTGQLAGVLAPFAGKVIGVDESAAMLKAARQRLRHFTNVELHRGTLESLPIETGTLDLALAVLVLHYLVDPFLAVDEAARALRPGGRVLIVDMMPHERAEYRDLMGHQSLGFQAETVAEWCRNAGLTKLTYRRLPPRPNAKGPLLFVATATKPQ